ncbi:MAG: general secretion pathway protein GspK [Spirochaetes bacterium]|nr:general secretion pathway protein GspK [Spirochaetota bacterium]
MSSFRSRKKRFFAFALVTVMVFVLLLSLVALEFSKRTGISLKLAVNFADKKQAQYYAFGGYQAALALLRGDSNDYDGPKDVWYGPLPPIPFDRGYIVVSIEDEKAKFNVKDLVVSQADEWVVQERRRSMLRRLFDELELDTAIVDTIVDWEDTNDLPEAAGVESAFYESLLPPYTARNEPVATTGELLLVKGIDRKKFFLPPSARGYGEIEEIGPLSEYLTVYGDGSINVNTADLPVLLSLSLDMDEYIARDIIEYRKDHPFHEKADLKNVESVTDLLYDEISSIIDVESNIFRITAEGISNEIVSRISAVVMRQGEGFKVVYFNRSL